MILVNPIGAPALEGPRGILTRLAVFYYWAGARLPEEARATRCCATAPIVRVMSVSMAKTRMPSCAASSTTSTTPTSRASPTATCCTTRSSPRSRTTCASTRRRIAQPTLLVAAQRDDITPIEAERHLATLFPDATLVEIPDVGHLIHYETPAPAADAIRRFLAPSAAGTR